MKLKDLPDGWKYVAVPAKEFDNLMFWLERCSYKGHLDNCPDLIDPYEAYEKQILTGEV